MARPSEIDCCAAYEGALRRVRCASYSAVILGRRITGQLDEGRYISLGEAAARCGLSHPQLRLLARTGRLKAFKIGKTWVTTPEAVAEYMSDPQLRSKDPLKNKRA